jgi:6-phosphogluconate dehydrogenase
MKLAMIGLGKMGANMVRRLVKHNHEVVAYDTSVQSAQNLGKESRNILAVDSLGAAVAALTAPRVLWLMVPHQFVDTSIGDLLAAGVSQGDVIIDGGNSNYKQSKRRAAELAERGIHFVDSGTSGGVCGSKEAIAIIKPALETLAPSATSGWGHVGPAGAGHYVKMVHNGIEYGLMQAYAEGFELMSAKQEMQLDMNQIAHIWQHGSVVRSWLLDLIADALDDKNFVDGLSDYVDDSGEGRWTIEDSIENAVPTPVLSLALQMRFRSRQSPSYAGKLLNAMRAGFGGHTVRNVKK